MEKERSVEAETKSGWQDETAQRAESLIEFLRNKIGKNKFEIGDFDITGNHDAVIEVINGNGQVLEIKVYRDNDGNIGKIHARFGADEPGKDADFFIQNKAIEEYLAEEK